MKIDRRVSITVNHPISQNQRRNTNLINVISQSDGGTKSCFTNPVTTVCY